jgi:hypothetical protein
LSRIPTATNQHRILCTTTKALGLIVVLHPYHQPSKARREKENPRVRDNRFQAVVVVHLVGAFEALCRRQIYHLAGREAMQAV